MHLAINNMFLRDSGMASAPKMEYQVFLCIFQKNSAMPNLDLKEMGKFLWKVREKGLSCCLFQFVKTKLGRPFSLPSQRNFSISFQPKVAIAKFIGKMQKKVWYFEKWVGRHASFPPRWSFKGHLILINFFNLCLFCYLSKYVID